MATYIQGLSDYVPQVQPFKPDFNFYQNVLQRKQQQYDVGFQQVSSIYNSILNAPMLRDSNIQKRDQFFADAEMQIQRLSGIDLSLPQNVESAYGVFKPFYEDNNIVNDIAWTRKYQEELSRAESFRNCTDEAKCGGKYWDGGVRALNYRANEFREATDSEALDMRAPVYTPYQNIMKMATQAAKDSGLSVKYDEIQGGYIVTTKNGPKLEIPLMNYFAQVFGEDPLVQQFYQTKAYLMRKENPDAAEKIFAKGIIDPTESQDPKAVDSKVSMATFEDEAGYIKEKASEENNRLEVLLQRKAAFDKTITKRGIDPTSKDGQEYIQLLEDIEAQKRFSTSLGTTSERANEISMRNQEFGPNYDQMESIIAQSLLLKDIGAAAHTLAYRDYEQTFEADPYALEARKHANAVSLKKMQFQHDYTLADFKNTNSKKMKYLDYMMKEGVIDPENLDLFLQEGDPLDDQLRAMIMEKNKSTAIAAPDGGTSDVGLVQSIIEGANPHAAFKTYAGKYYKLTTNNGETSLPIKQGIGREYLTTITNLATDRSSNPDAELSRSELAYMGNRIHYNLTKFEKEMREGKKTPISDFSPEVIRKLRQWPSDTKNSKNISPEFFASMKDYMDEVVDVIGGDVSFYRYLTENGGSIGAKSKVSVIQDQFSQNSKLRSYANVLDASKKTSISYFNNAGVKAQKSTSNLYAGSDDWYESFISKNIWKNGDNEKGKYGKMASKEDLIDKVMRLPKNDHGVLSMAKAEYAYNPITDKESDYGIKLSNESLFNVLMIGSNAVLKPENSNRIETMAKQLEKSTGKKINIPSNVAPQYHSKYYADYLAKNFDAMNVKRTGDYFHVGLKNSQGKPITIDLNDTRIQKQYMQRMDHINDKYDNVANQFLTSYQEQKTPLNNKDFTAGGGAFTAKELSFNVSPFVKNADYKHGIDFAKEIVNNRSSVSGDGNIDLLNEWIQDYGPGKKWSQSAKGLPTAFMEVKPIAGDIYHSELTITFNDNYLKDKGYNKYNKETGQWDLNEMPKTQVFRIKNSQSEVVKKSMPNPFTVLLANKGDTYTEDPMLGGENSPKFTYTNVGNDMIKVSLDTPIFDVETGTYWNPISEPIMISKIGTDWQNFHSDLLDQIEQINAINQDNLQKYNQIMGTTNPKSLGE